MNADVGIGLDFSRFAVFDLVSTHDENMMQTNVHEVQVLGYS